MNLAKALFERAPQSFCMRTMRNAVLSSEPASSASKRCENSSSFSMSELRNLRSGRDALSGSENRLGSPYSPLSSKSGIRLCSMRSSHSA